jgi:hypothetical protein
MHPPPQPSLQPCAASLQPCAPILQPCHVQVERAKATTASDAASGALRLSLAPAATREEELFQAFCDLDHDRSGKLDPTELRGALKGVGLEMGSEQAQGLLSQYDADGSGLLEFDEFQELCTALEALHLRLAPSAAPPRALRAPPQPPQPPLALLAALEEEEWEVMVQEASLLYGEQAALERDAFELAARRLDLAAELVWLRAREEVGEVRGAALEARATDARRELAHVLREAAPRRAACEANAARVAALRSEASERVPSHERQQLLRLCLANHGLALRAERRGQHAALLSSAVGGVVARWGDHSVHESEVAPLLQLGIRVADALLASLEAAAAPTLDLDAGIAALRLPAGLGRGPATAFEPPPATLQRPAAVSLAVVAAALEGHGAGSRGLLRQATQSLREARQQRLSLRQLHEALARAEPEAAAADGAVKNGV